MPDRFTEMLSDFLDDELDAASRAELEQHLRDCAECRATLADLRRVVSAARALPPRAPGDAVWTAVSRELASGPPASAGPPPARARRLSSHLLAAASLLIAVSLGAIGSAWWRDAREPSAGPRWLLLLHESSTARARPPGGEDLPTIIGHYAEWRRDYALLGEKLADDAGLRLDPDGTPVEVAPARPASDPIGGLFIITAKDEAEATAIARTCPHLNYGGWIELRRIEDTSHVR